MRSRPSIKGSLTDGVLALPARGSRAVPQAGRLATKVQPSTARDNGASPNPSGSRFQSILTQGCSAVQCSGSKAYQLP